MAKNCQNSRFGGKSRHICANLAIFSLFTGVTSLLITFQVLKITLSNIMFYFKVRPRLFSHTHQLYDPTKLSCF